MSLILLIEARLKCAISVAAHLPALTDPQTILDAHLQLYYYPDRPSYPTFPNLYSVSMKTPHETLLVESSEESLGSTPGHLDSLGIITCHFGT